MERGPFIYRMHIFVAKVMITMVCALIVVGLVFFWFWAYHEYRQPQEPHSYRPEELPDYFVFAFPLVTTCLIPFIAAEALDWLAWRLGPHRAIYKLAGLKRQWQLPESVQSLMNRYGRSPFLRMVRVLGTDSRYLLQYGVPEIESMVRSAADLVDCTLLTSGLARAKSRLRGPVEETKDYPEREEVQGFWRTPKMGEMYNSTGSSYDQVWDPGQSAREAYSVVIVRDNDREAIEGIDRVIAALTRQRL